MSVVSRGHLLAFARAAGYGIIADGMCLADGIAGPGIRFGLLLAIQRGAWWVWDGATRPTLELPPSTPT